ncbi:YadA-like family protein [Luteibacter sp. PvP120]
MSATGAGDGSDDASATGAFATAIGAGSRASGDLSTAQGAFATASRTSATAIGASANAGATSATAIGDSARALGVNSVALGAGSVATRANTVSVGGTSGNRQITNVAAGTQTTDAVNLGQLNTAMSGAFSGTSSLAGNTMAMALGGGATMGANGFVGPVYKVQGGAYSTVGDAVGALDGALSSIGTRVNKLESAAGGSTIPGATPVRRNALVSTSVASTTQTTAADETASAPVTAAAAPVVAAAPVTAAAVAEGTGGGTAIGTGSFAKDPTDLAVGTNATVGADNGTAVGTGATVTAAATNSVALGANSVADQADTVSVGSATAQRRVTNVAAGTATTDAANVGQVDQAVATAKSYADQGDATTLTSAKAYTDQKFGDVVSGGAFDDYKRQVDHRFNNLNDRLNRVGAMGAAMSQMAFSTQGVSGDNRLGVGVGGYKGQGALSVGYSRSLSPRASLTFGAAVSGGESSGGVGVGVGW